LAMTSAHAGDLSLSGSMEVTWTTGSGRQDTGNNFGQENEMDITASTELDNGTGVAYKRSLTAAQAGSDSELVFTGLPFVGGSLAMTSTGSPISAIDDVTPTAFEEANAQVGSVDDVNGMDGTFGIRYTLADVAGSGITFDAMYTPVHGAGDAAADQSTATAHGNDTGTEVVLKGAVPFVEGLDFGVGYALLESQDATDSASSVSEGSIDQDEGTAYIKYAYGPLSVGVQKGAVSLGQTGTTYVTDILGVAYSVTDDLSVSYNMMESARTATDGLRTEQEFDSISIGYTMGGMSLKIADADCSKCSYTHTGRNQDETTVSLSVAF
jgi:outer membrane protein OmpU